MPQLAMMFLEFAVELLNFLERGVKQNLPAVGMLVPPHLGGGDALGQRILFPALDVDLGPDMNPKAHLFERGIVAASHARPPISASSASDSSGSHSKTASCAGLTRR